jgi:hypothetical protein
LRILRSGVSWTDSLGFEGLVIMTDPLARNVVLRELVGARVPWFEEDTQLPVTSMPAVALLLPMTCGPYVPGSTTTVSPGDTTAVMWRNVAQGLASEQGLLSLPVVET